MHQVSNHKVNTDTKKGATIGGRGRGGRYQEDGHSFYLIFLGEIFPGKSNYFQLK
jgi:hypothetical protein